MTLQTRLFTTTQGCTDGDAARVLMHEITRLLDPIYERGTIAGFHAAVLETEDDFADRDLDRPLIERETHGVLPALYLNVTYKLGDAPPDDAAIEPVIAQFALRHLLTESDAP